MVYRLDMCCEHGLGRQRGFPPFNNIAGEREEQAVPMPSFAHRRDYSLFIARGIHSTTEETKCWLE